MADFFELDRVQAENIDLRHCVIRRVRLKCDRVFERGPYGGWYEVTVA